MLDSACPRHMQSKQLSGAPKSKGAIFTKMFFYVSWTVEWGSEGTKCMLWLGHHLG